MHLQVYHSLEPSHSHTLSHPPSLSLNITHSLTHSHSISLSVVHSFTHSMVPDGLLKCKPGLVMTEPQYCPHDNSVCVPSFTCIHPLIPSLAFNKHMKFPLLHKFVAVHFVCTNLILLHNKVRNKCSISATSINRTEVYMKMGEGWKGRNLEFQPF